MKYILFHILLSIKKNIILKIKLKLIIKKQQLFMISLKNSYVIINEP